VSVYPRKRPHVGLVTVIDLSIRSPVPSLKNIFLGIMAEGNKAQKTIVIGAGPVGALAALYAAQRGHNVDVYELRSGTF
jgi:NADPH-dependent 2,4-dienoyl-CoA reductase/sulfur reductase-like enzyme